MNIIIDSGPLLAILDKRDHYHKYAIHKMGELKAPFLTCESVLSETFFLLQRANASQKPLLDLLHTGKIKTSFSYKKNTTRVHQIISAYANLPASFADACLVAMAESIKSYKIFTLDRDFSIYRTSKGTSLSLIIP